MEGSKVCTKCGVEKSLGDYVFRNSKKKELGRVSHCGKCRRDAGRRYYQRNKREITLKRRNYLKGYYEKNKERLKQRARDHRKENRESINSRVRLNREKNKDKINAKKRSIQSKQRLEISDGYCKKLIANKVGLKAHETPRELIELKREMILLYRVNKELKKLQDKLNQ